MMELEHMNKFDYLARLKEPSTYAGFAALASVFGVNFAPVELQGMSMIGAAVAAVLAMFLPERGKRGR